MGSVKSSVVGSEDGRKFYVLDALRGIAALTVVQLHTSRFFGAQLFHHAGLAVDFFFMLSGFVLAFAYQQKLDAGWSTKVFLKVRLIRLYPLYLLGLLLGTAFWLLRGHFGHTGNPNLAIGLAFSLGLLVLPMPPGTRDSDQTAFPLNLPTWSLFYEVLANVFHATLLRRRSTLFLSIVTGLASIALIVTVLLLQTMDCGSGRTNIYYGITRALFAYPAGILVFQIWRRGNSRNSVSPFLPAILLLAILAGPWNSGVWYDLLSIVVFFPALLYIGACSTPSASLIPATHWMGITSYAIYVLHNPLASFFELVWSRLAHHNIELDAPWGGILYLVIMLLFAVWIDRVYDLKVRSFLRRRLS